MKTVDMENVEYLDNAEGSTDAIAATSKHVVLPVDRGMCKGSHAEHRHIH